jgi:tRNA(Arg) A34 adenosine deaminase TadA
MNRDEQFMRLAIEQARVAAAMGEVPIGAVVVCNGEIVARAHNRREVDADPAAHAEFLALRATARVLERWRLSGCTIYVTLEPCLMCAGLMYQARVDACVYGAPDPKGGALGTLYSINSDERLNHNFTVRSGVLAGECAGLLSNFFGNLRAGREKPGDACDAQSCCKQEGSQ